MDTLKYKGYCGTVEYSKADDCLVGKVLGMKKDSITYEGESLMELKDDFVNGIDSYLEGCKKHGIEPDKPFSGTLNIRIGPEAHSRIALIAGEQGTSINALIKAAIQEYLDNKAS